MWLSLLATKAIGIGKLVKDGNTQEARQHSPAPSWCGAPPQHRAITPQICMHTTPRRRVSHAPSVPLAQGMPWKGRWREQAPAFSSDTLPFNPLSLDADVNRRVAGKPSRVQSIPRLSKEKPWQQVLGEKKNHHWCTQHSWRFLHGRHYLRSPPRAGAGQTALHKA